MMAKTNHMLHRLLGFSQLHKIISYKTKRRITQALLYIGLDRRQTQKICIDFLGLNFLTINIVLLGKVPIHLAWSERDTILPLDIVWTRTFSDSHKERDFDMGK